MKRTFLTVAVFALLGTLAVSCQKETAETGNVICNGDPSALVYYSIDGETFQTIPDLHLIKENLMKLEHDAKL